MQIHDNNREKNYYQIKVVGLNHAGNGILKTLHILACNYSESIRLSKTITHFEYQCFEEFLLKYRFLKIALLQYYRQLEGYEISRFHVIACLHVFKMDNRFDEDVPLLILTQARRLIGNYLRNKR